MIVGNIGLRLRVPPLPARSRCCGIVAAAALALSACSVGPPYTRPETPSPETWRNAEPNVPVAWPSADWWRGFRSPQLDLLVAEAQRANDDIAAAVARVLEADAQTRIAGAALSPAVAATGDASRERSRPGGGSLRTFSNYSAQLSASYELDFWGKNRAALDAAKATLAASRYDRATVELTVLTGVAGTYFQVLELRERANIAERHLAGAQAILQGLRLRQKAGTGNALDVAQQETAVATLYASIPALEQQLRQSVHALAVLIGKPPEVVEIGGGTLAELAQPAVQPGLPSALLARRPDVAEAEARLIAANADIGRARSAFFPSIQLTGSTGFESPALSGLLSHGNAVYAIAAGLIQPIFQGGALEGQSAFAKARYAELVADYHKTVIAAFANVEDALVALRQTGEQEERQRQAVATAHRAYGMAQAQLHAGTIDILTLLSTESALFTAEDAMAQVKLSHLQALIGLFNALGGGWRNPQEG